jgi:putative ABC transport system substrate-binding protein
MRRRDFIALAAGAAVAWPLTARAQQPRKVPRVGVLLGKLPDPVRVVSTIRE